jgi:hypothetical protein
MHLLNNHLIVFPTKRYIGLDPEPIFLEILTHRMRAFGTNLSQQQPCPFRLRFEANEAY